MAVNLDLENTKSMLPDLVRPAPGKNSTKGKGKGKAQLENVAILNDIWSGSPQRDPNSLSDSLPRARPKLFIAAEEQDFDASIMEAWKTEGFHVEYLAMLGEGPDAEKAFATSTLRRLHVRAKPGPCETFGLVAFGDAASVALEYYHVLENNFENQLGCLIAYYPSRVPDPQTRFPAGVRQVVVHLVANQNVAVVKHSQILRAQGKRRVSNQMVGRGLGTGGLLKWQWNAYAYEDVDAGFAERDLEEYDPVAAGLAWSRSVAAAKKAFGMVSFAEGVVESCMQAKLYNPQPEHAASHYLPATGHLTHIPTLTGATGAADLQHFYTDFFANANYLPPSSLQLTLLSRTVGADRVVDELHVRFKHTQEIPWLLPRVPPTRKKVEFVMVVIVALRGSRIVSEHVYWDQASVLLQTGLLDAEEGVSEKGRQLGVKMLPVVGREAARRLAGEDGDEEQGEADNDLIYSESDEGDEDENEDNGQNGKAGREGRIEESGCNHERTQGTDEEDDEEGEDDDEDDDEDEDDDDDDEDDDEDDNGNDDGDGADDGDGKGGDGVVPQADGKLEGEEPAYRKGDQNGNASINPEEKPPLPERTKPLSSMDQPN